MLSADIYSIQTSYFIYTTVRNNTGYKIMFSKIAAQRDLAKECESHTMS